MTTGSDLRRSRARRRGFATFVAFLLLFAFALGQSSLTALADPKKDAVVEETSDAGSVPEATTSDEAPAEDASADEAPADDAPADEAAAADEAPADADAGASSGAGAAAASSVAGSSKKGNARDDRNVALAGNGIVIQNHGGLHGGDIDLDFVAAGPFTYDHSTGVGTYPTFGFNDRTIDKDDGVVESLESGDFECGDLVTFFTQIVVDAGADGGGAIDLDYEFDRSTTGQPGILYTDIIDGSIAVNTPDDGNVGLDGNETATLIAENNLTDPITGTVRVAGLDPGDTVIVRMSVELDCIQGEQPTGNLLAVIDDADVVDGDNIPVGNQTVPMKTTGFVPEPAIDIEKDCPPEAAFGEDITFTITIENNGNENLENIVVMDTVDGNAPVDISDLFADTLAVGASETQDFVYTPDGTEPDPITNSVTVTADGVGSQTEVTDTDECDTDITHEPGIDVEKSCPSDVLLGEEIEYTITVENTGNEPLVGVEVTDTILGNITDEFDFDFTDPFPVGETATATVFFTPDAEGPVTNVVTATGTGEDSETEDSDTAECTTDVLNPDIEVTKSCPVGAVGEEIEYTITVTNTGNEDLENLVVMDTVDGHEAVAVPAQTTLAIGEEIELTFTYTVQEGDPDPLPNSVTATATGVESEAEVSDTDECVSDLLNPAIDIVKTVSDDTVPVGTTVTYTYVITNTGDTTLFDVTVDDDVLGHIGDIPVLEPGQSVTMTKEFVVGESPVVNVAIAEGEDVLGRTVSADDDALVTPILGNPPPTPFTGSDAAVLGMIAIGLFGLGATLVAATRRRRARETA